MALVSVVVPCYKVEKYIKQCIVSLMNQTLKDIEIILIDDGSPDATGLICDEFAQIDDRILVVHKPNGGLSSARNTGIAKSCGDYISFIDSDDFIDSDFLEQLYNNAVSFKSDLTVAGITVEFTKSKNINIIDPSVSNSYSDPKEFGKLYMCLHENKLSNYSCNKLYRRSFLIESNLYFDKKGVPAEDLLFNLSAFMYARKISVLCNHGYHYIKRDEESILSRYHENLVNVDHLRIQSYKTFLDYFHFEEIEKLNILEKLIVSSKQNQIYNIYKKDSPLNFTQRTNWFKNNLFQEKHPNLINKSTKSKMFLFRIFCFVLKVNSPMFANILYSLLFWCRHKFSFLYYMFRSNLIK